MKIRIAQALHPFSHLPGTTCLLPYSHLKVQIFPTRVHFSLFEEILFSLTWDIQGPVKDFTVEMDLEQQQIVVFGMATTGYFRYRLKRQNDGIGVIVDKLVQKTINCDLSHHNQTYHLARGDILLIPRVFVEQLPVISHERLSLGMHTVQDWPRIKSRLDFKEIFPIWMRLGQVTPHLPHTLSTKGNFSLLDTCHRIVNEDRKQEVIPAFKQLFLAAFESLCIPRLYDTDYQGILPVEQPETIDPSPITLLTQGAALIRSLFFQESHEVLSLLPCIPPDFHAGRLVEVHTLLGDRLDFEWSKKQLRSVILRPHSERRMFFKISQHIRTCRVRSSLKERGKEHMVQEGVLALDVSADCPLFIDRFEK